MSPLRLLSLAAVLAEVGAAVLLMEATLEKVVVAVAVHVVATGLFGVSLLTRAEGRRLWCWPAIGWTVGLLAFPLAGMLTTLVAFGLTRGVYPRLRPVRNDLVEVTSLDDRPTDAVAAAHELEVALLDELEIEPIVDVLREDDPELKRAAIEAVVKQRGAGAVRLLIGLLHDPSQEARFFSSIGLSKLEDEFSRAILGAQRALSEDPTSTVAQEELAGLYLDYAVSGFLEGVTRQYYLDLSRQTFESALPATERPDDLLYRLARVHLLLGNIAEAAAILDDLARRRPDDVEIPLLRMGVIFQFGDLRELVLFARRVLPNLPADSEVRDLAEWWAGTGQEELAVA